MMVTGPKNSGPVSIVVHARLSAGGVGRGARDWDEGFWDVEAIAE